MQLQRLNFPAYNFKLQKATPDGQSIKIFDIVRKKFVLLTPEEWVRQHVLQFMMTDRGYPQSLMSVEKKLTLNGLTKRTDIVAYGKNHLPLVLVECKAPEIALDQRVFDQAARYNMILKVDYYVLSNGLDTYCCVVNHKEQNYSFLPEIPLFSDLSV